MLREAIRFPGKIISATISQDGEKFFASFNIETSKIVFEATHRENVQEALCGCDWGVKDLLTFSNGIKIKGSKYLRKKERKLTRLQKKLAKKQHRRTKVTKRRNPRISLNSQKSLENCIERSKFRGLTRTKNFKRPRSAFRSDLFRNTER